MGKQQNTSNKQNTCLVLTEQKLYQFSQTPLTQFSKQGLEGSSSSATVICAFLIGAAETFASDDETLQLIIAERLELDDRGTIHLIDTTRRLSKKYPFVENILKQGQQTSSAWQDNDTHSTETTLDQLLQKCQNLTLMDLKQIDGSEEKLSTARASVTQAVKQNPRLKRLLLILLALIILITANHSILTIF